MAGRKEDAEKGCVHARTRCYHMLEARLTTVRKQLRALNVSAIQLQPSVCDFCGGGHSSGDCQVGNTFAHAQNEQSKFINNFQCSNNSYSNPAWNNHPNLTWGDNFQ